MGCKKTEEGRKEGTRLIRSRRGGCTRTSNEGAAAVGYNNAAAAGGEYHHHLPRFFAFFFSFFFHKRSQRVLLPYLGRGRGRMIIRLFTTAVFSICSTLVEGFFFFLFFRGGVRFF